MASYNCKNDQLCFTWVLWSTFAHNVWWWPLCHRQCLIVRPLLFMWSLGYTMTYGIHKFRLIYHICWHTILQLWMHTLYTINIVFHFLIGGVKCLFNRFIATCVFLSFNCINYLNNYDWFYRSKVPKGIISQYLTINWFC